MLFRKCGVDMIDSVVAMIDEAYENLPQEQKDYLVVLDYKDYRKEIKNGFVVCAFDEDNSNILAGFVIVYFAGNDSRENYGAFVANNRTHLNRTVNIGTAVVSPYYQGIRLFEQLLIYAESFLDNQFDNLMCTVHPNNVPAYKSLIRVDYKDIMDVNTYGYNYVLMERRLGGN